MSQSQTNAHSMHPIVLQFRGESFRPIEFNAPLPLPGPPCTEAIPCEKRQQDLLKQEQMAKLRDERIAERSNTSHGVLQKLDVTCEKAINEIEKGVNSLLNGAASVFQAQNDDHAYGRLRANFPDHTGERLVGDFRCKLCTRNGVLSGFLQITNMHLLWMTDNGSNVAVPLKEILNVQKINTCNSTTLPPRFCAVANDSRAECIGVQAFLTSGQLLIFKEFLSIRGLPASMVQECFNVLDHMWRQSCEVPNANWTFIENDKFVQPDVVVYPPKTALSNYHSEKETLSTYS